MFKPKWYHWLLIIPGVIVGFFEWIWTLVKGYWPKGK